MTHEIDASFREGKARRRSARRDRSLRRLGAGAGVVLLLAAGTFGIVTADRWSFSDVDEELVMVEGADVPPEDAATYVPAIVDLAGDPMWLSLAPGSAGSPSQVRTLPKPAELDDPGISPTVALLSDRMVSASERFMTTIPSTQEDFAFFQTQATGGITATPFPDEMEEIAPDAEATAGEGTFSDEDPAAGWGETISAGEQSLPEFQKTAIADNTTVATVTPEPERQQSTEDRFVRVLAARSLGSVVQEQGFSADDARAADEALKALFQRDGLEGGFVVALRGARRNAGPFALMQASVYAGDRFVGTLARDASGRFVSGVDPWVRDDLFNYSGQPREADTKRQYRLLDAIYSTAARNNVPTAVIGEAIMLLSRGQDLDAFAAEDDRLVLLYSETPRLQQGASGRVLYAGVRSPERTLECFVFAGGDGAFACVGGDAQVHSLGKGGNDMVTPVKGVLTSTFGPRRHPILKTVRIHKGVDWAAPIGTPVVAAFDGTIAFQGNGGGYGNLLRISHAGGRETRYAHLQRFALGGVGVAVKAGEVVGFIGTTGLSTGPHLHFELYQGAQAVDPLAPSTVVVAAVSTVQTAVVVSTASSDDKAVELLTDRIVHVESGGRANAKNPLSTATGLGQFIESTWIRMMNTYRPDLAGSLSRGDLLALRFDPTISREMVRNLAREGEAYLRQRGHGITAGRLYLCHFLGMEGAHKVLSSPAQAALIDVLGAGVIRANPFLTGKDVAYVANWAERKMNRKAAPVVVTSSPTAPPPQPVQRETSPEFARYKAAVLALLGEMTARM